MRPAINVLPRLTRIPCVTTFHDLLVPFLFPKAGALRWRANQFLARGSRACIVTNAEDNQRLRPDSSIRMLRKIPIGSNISPSVPEGFDRYAFREEHGIPRRAVVLSYFGFLNASKGSEELIEAFHAVRESGVDAWLLMIGGSLGASDPTNRAYLERVETLIAARGLSSHVIWTGFVSEEGVSSAFAAADMCVLPFRDGISFRRGSLMAALAHGVPVVSTVPTVTLPELEHGRNVLLVEPDQPEALTRAVLSLAESPALRLRLGEAARQLSRSFSWDAIAERTLEVYRACLGR